MCKLNCDDTFTYNNNGTYNEFPSPNVVTTTTPLSSQPTSYIDSIPPTGAGAVNGARSDDRTYAPAYSPPPGSGYNSDYTNAYNNNNSNNDNYIDRNTYESTGSMTDYGYIGGISSNIPNTRLNNPQDIGYNNNNILDTTRYNSNNSQDIGYNNNSNNTQDTTRYNNNNSTQDTTGYNSHNNNSTPDLRLNNTQDNNNNNPQDTRFSSTHSEPYGGSNRVNPTTPGPLSAQPAGQLQRSMTYPAPAVVMGNVTLDLSNKSTRLKTFITYPPESAVRPTELAEAGFYYECREDLVRCYRCSVMLGSWVPGDTAWNEHRKFSPNCELVLEKYHGIPPQPYRCPAIPVSPTPPPTTSDRPLDPRAMYAPMGGPAARPAYPDQQYYNNNMQLQQQQQQQQGPMRPGGNPYFDGYRNTFPSSIDQSPIYPSPTVTPQSPQGHLPQQQQQRLPQQSPQQPYLPQPQPQLPPRQSPLMMNASPVYSPGAPPLYNNSSLSSGMSSSGGPSPGLPPQHGRISRQHSDGSNVAAPFSNFSKSAFCISYRITQYYLQ